MVQRQLRQPAGLLRRPRWRPHIGVQPAHRSRGLHLRHRPRPCRPGRAGQPPQPARDSSLAMGGSPHPKSLAGWLSFLPRDLGRPQGRARAAPPRLSLANRFSLASRFSLATHRPGRARRDLERDEPGQPVRGDLRPLRLACRQLLLLAPQPTALASAPASAPAPPAGAAALAALAAVTSAAAPAAAEPAGAAVDGAAACAVVHAHTHRHRPLRRHRLHRVPALRCPAWSDMVGVALAWLAAAPAAARPCGRAAVRPCSYAPAPGAIRCLRAAL